MALTYKYTHGRINAHFGAGWIVSVIAKLSEEGMYNV